jgi:hypothetical protein
MLACATEAIANGGKRNGMPAFPFILRAMTHWTSSIVASKQEPS